MAKYLWLEKEKSDRSRARDINTIKIYGYGNFNGLRWKKVKNKGNGQFFAVAIPQAQTGVSIRLVSWLKTRG
jgi:hypothetical protein